MPEIIPVSPDSIKENEVLTTTQKRKGGPFGKRDRFLRRQKVYQLHFEIGHSALKISQMLQVNRHTIEVDIQFWHSKLAKDWQENDIDAWAQKQLNRFELQRTNLLEDLGKPHDPKERLAINKMITEIDEKIIRYFLLIAKTQKELIVR